VCVCAGVCVIAVALQQLQTITQLYAMPQPQTHNHPLTTHSGLAPSRSHSLGGKIAFCVHQLLRISQLRCSIFFYSLFFSMFFCL